MIQLIFMLSIKNGLVEMIDKCVKKSKNESEIFEGGNKECKNCHKVYRFRSIWPRMFVKAIRQKIAYKERLETSYQTPYGSMMFHTFTNHMHVSLKDRPYSGKVDIEYDLFMATDKIGAYKLALEFTA